MSSRNGTIVREGEQATIRFERRLPHSLERVWAAVTEPDQRAQWFGPSSIEPRVGGQVHLVAEGPPAPPEVRTVTGQVTAWEPPRLLEYEHNQTLVGRTLVRFELSPDGAGTLLVMTHRRLAPAAATGFIPGTHAYLDRLEAVVAGETLPPWMDRYAAVAPHYGGSWR